jgi:hypothetical protein
MCLEHTRCNSPPAGRGRTYNQMASCQLPLLFQLFVWASASRQPKAIAANIALSRNILPILQWDFKPIPKARKWGKNLQN